MLPCVIADLRALSMMDKETELRIVLLERQIVRLLSHYSYSMARIAELVEILDDAISGSPANFLSEHKKERISTIQDILVDAQVELDDFFEPDLDFEVPADDDRDR